ncbi:MAG: hypothetical protein KJ587_19935 [Alphaproteobacteria bacterium]|nr:hypothetical protein [Alphaproteobacteria bacterium]
MVTLKDLKEKVEQICRHLQEMVKTKYINHIGVKTSETNRFEAYYLLYNQYSDLASVGVNSFDYWLYEWHPQAKELLGCERIKAWAENRLSLYPQYLEAASFVRRAYYQMKDKKSRQVTKESPSGTYTVWETYTPDEYKEDWAVAIKLVANVSELAGLYRHYFGEGIPTERSRATESVPASLPAKVELAPPLTVSEIATRCKEVLSLRIPVVVEPEKKAVPVTAPEEAIPEEPIVAELVAEAPPKPPSWLKWALGLGGIILIAILVAGRKGGK